MVVDGAVRDVDDIVRLGFSVFARHICPRAGTFAEIGEWQTTVVCGRIPVSPGDWVVGDVSGVAVVPSGRLESVAAAAETLLAKEEHLEDSLRRGGSLLEAGAAYKRTIAS